MDTTPAATGPKIFNVLLTNAGQEYSQLLQDGSDNTKPSMKKIQLRCRNTTHTLQYRYETPDASLFDLAAGETYWQDGLDSYGRTIYLTSPNAGCIVDIEVWY